MDAIPDFKGCQQKKATAFDLKGEEGERKETNEMEKMELLQGDARSCRKKATVIDLKGKEGEIEGDGRDGEDGSLEQYEWRRASGTK